MTKLHTEFGVGDGHSDKFVWVIQKGGEIGVTMTRATGSYRLGFWTVETDKLPARVRRAVVPPTPNADPSGAAPTMRGLIVIAEGMSP